MKICTKCRVTKPEEEFYKCSRWPDGLQKQCKECHKGINKKHYSAGKDSYLSRAESQRKEANELVRFIKEEIPCSICGEDKWWRLAFHHVNSEEKEVTIALIRSLPQLLRELPKCIVVCHNCHADIHHEQRVGGSMAQQ